MKADNVAAQAYCAGLLRVTTRFSFVFLLWVVLLGVSWYSTIGFIMGLVNIYFTLQSTERVETAGRVGGKIGFCFRYVDNTYSPTEWVTPEEITSTVARDELWICLVFAIVSGLVLWSVDWLVHTFVF